jgi:hypothetical protein
VLQYETEERKNHSGEGSGMSDYYSRQKDQEELEIKRKGLKVSYFSLVIAIIALCLSGLSFLFGNGILRSSKPYNLPCDGKDCPGKAFIDMPAKGTWTHNAIDWALDQGILTGTSSTTLGPTEVCTRGMVLDFIYVAEGKPDYKETDSLFSDVARGDKYYAPVMWAIENKLTKGVNTKKFGVDDSCTREQVLVFIYAARGKPEPSLKISPYQDVKDPDAWYYNAILWAMEKGIVTEDKSGKFGVGNLCTREEAVTYLYRVYGG